jgi:diguanylate cyclase (GGDEF)-like protein/PAS domain S-box-containing protein
MAKPRLSTTILLIGNDPTTADSIRASLAAPEYGQFDVEWVRQLSAGLERLGKEGIATVLLDLALPDSQGIATFEKVFAAAPNVPILILAGAIPEALAREAVERGAHDYLIGDRLDYLLPRALSNAIERKAVEDTLHLERERAVVTLNSIGDAVLCTDTAGIVTYLNPVAVALTGWNLAEAIGKRLAEVFRIVDGATRKTARDPLKMAIDQNRTVGLTVNCVLIRRDGHEFSIEDSAAPIHDRTGRVTGAVIVFHDVSTARAMSHQMTHVAQHDVLTDLPNRLLLNDRIGQAISEAHREHTLFAVLFLDLDNFKHINDSLGHAVGDKLLQSVSRRLLASVRDSDTVSRQGGDEFVILLPHISHPDDAAPIAEKILLSLTAPHMVETRLLHTTGSIGICVYPVDGADADTLIKNADVAMYDAKEKGRNNCQFFEAEMNLRAVERQTTEASLHQALVQGEFLLLYQPKVNLETGEIAGIEALIRWQHPDRGLVLPSQFVTIAEDCGLIVEIGRWVLREACRQARAWQDTGFPPIPIAVNVSAIEFRHPGFVESVRTILLETRLEAQYLELELTESVLMKDAEAAVSLLQQLKVMGVRLAVDDFGTGYSSLSYLRQFPIDVLKIDQSFIATMAGSGHDSRIVGAIINLGKSLGQRVIAEGVETEGQRVNLQTQFCAEGQGYLFSKPLAALAFERLLQTGLANAVVN